MAESLDQVSQDYLVDHHALQIVYLMENIAEEVGWGPVRATQQIAWAYLQTADSLAQVLTS